MDGKVTITIRVGFLGEVLSIEIPPGISVTIENVHTQFSRGRLSNPGETNPGSCHNIQVAMSLRRVDSVSFLPANVVLQFFQDHSWAPPIIRGTPYCTVESDGLEGRHSVCIHRV